MSTPKVTPAEGRVPLREGKKVVSNKRLEEARANAAKNHQKRVSRKRLTVDLDRREDTGLEVILGGETKFYPFFFGLSTAQYGQVNRKHLAYLELLESESEDSTRERSEQALDEFCDFVLSVAFEKGTLPDGLLKQVDRGR